MNSPTPITSRQTVTGTIRVFSAELLILPAGLVSAAFLTRQLGPEGYGFLTLAGALVVWIEGSIGSIFARATIRFVGGTEDWRLAATVVLRSYLITSLGATGLLWLLSGPIAGALAEPSLKWYLRLFALDVPCSVLPMLTPTS